MRPKILFELLSITLEQGDLNSKMNLPFVAWALLLLFTTNIYKACLSADEVLKTPENNKYKMIEDLMGFRITMPINLNNILRKREHLVDGSYSIMPATQFRAN